MAFGPGTYDHKNLRTIFGPFSITCRNSRPKRLPTHVSLWPELKPVTTAIRAEINRKNAQNSTGPTSESGKRKSALNGIKHGLTGQRLLLLPHEVEPYQRMSGAFRSDYNPQTELESQLVQHIADCNMRLHRIAAIESNMFAVGTIDNIREHVEHDDATEAVIAQTRAWIKQADSFEKLGRHEGRISRQLLKYTQEMDRVQTNRRNNPVQLEETKPDNTELASSCKTPAPAENPPQKSPTATVVTINAAACVSETSKNNPPKAPEGLTPTKQAA
jgi:hypothetical protein